MNPEERTTGHTASSRARVPSVAAIVGVIFALLVLGAGGYALSRQLAPPGRMAAVPSTVVATPTAGAPAFEASPPAAEATNCASTSPPSACGEAVSPCPGKLPSCPHSVSPTCPSVQPCVVSGSPATTGSPRPCQGCPPPASPTATPAPQCGVSEVSATLTTDHQSYPTGQQVNFAITVKNTSSHACSVNRMGGCRVGPSIYDSNGQLVWPTGPQPMCASMITLVTLQPGQSDTVAAAWGQQTCAGGNQCSNVPAGTYTAKWSYTAPATVTFRVG
ncbi:MAG: BsuPI-related putative proteinase inhibitor [Candidatus Dormibacteria bacterium]